MPTIVSPVGRGQGNELVNRLEAAGLNFDLAQKVIDSKDNDLATKVVRLIQNGGFEPTTSQKRAREIMGDNMFGVEQAIAHFGVNPSRQQIAALAERDGVGGEDAGSPRNDPGGDKGQVRALREEKHRVGRTANSFHRFASQRNVADRRTRRS